MQNQNSTVVPLSIRLFGPARVEVDGELLQLPRIKITQLLALLTLRHSNEVSRIWLASTLWMDTEESTARDHLSRHLAYLKKALGRQAYRLAATRDTIQLDLTGAFADVVAFDAAIARDTAASLKEAVMLYRGTLFEGWYEEWAEVERKRRTGAVLDALQRLAVHAVKHENYTEAVDYLRRFVTEEPYQENAYRLLMEALAKSGDFAAVTTVYHDLRRLLRQNMNADVEAETSALFRKLQEEARAGRQQTSPVTPPALTSMQRVRLPSPISSFVGRVREMGAVGKLLESHRLITLVGIGGIGKSRLALQVAGEKAEDFLDGVGYVDLAPLEDPDLVLQRLATTLGIRDMDVTSLAEKVENELSAAHLLLVLDNCEHLSTACASLIENLLNNCPRLKVLTTSRQVLGVPGERRYRVSGLAIAAPATGKPTREGVPSDAVQLFMTRAQDAHTNFGVTSDCIPTVAHICNRLEGIPLALELAAARVRSMPLETIAAGLSDRFRILTGGSDRSLLKHRTLQATMDWSYNLLHEPARGLLRHLGVFAGSWTQNAAEQVCGISGLMKEDILSLLTTLVDHSLIIFYRPETIGRFRMLETVREYSLNRWMEESESEIDEIRARHCLYYVEMAQVWKRNLPLTPADYLDERDNMIAALQYGRTRHGYYHQHFDETGPPQYEPEWPPSATERAIERGRHAKREN